MLTWAPTASITARQSHLLHLPSPLFGYVPRSGVKVSKKQHEQTSTRLLVVRVRRKKGGKRRDQNSLAGVQRFVEKKNGTNRSGLGGGQHQQLRSRSANLKKCSGRSAQHRKSGHCLLCVKKSSSFTKRLRQEWEWERERGGGGSRETSSKTNWLEGPHWIKDTGVLTYLRLGDWRRTSTRTYSLPRTLVFRGFTSHQLGSSSLTMQNWQTYAALAKKKVSEKVNHSSSLFEDTIHRQSQRLLGELDLWKQASIERVWCTCHSGEAYTGKRRSPTSYNHERTICTGIEILPCTVAWADQFQTNLT